jgi:hypothetical protein
VRGLGRELTKPSTMGKSPIEKIHLSPNELNLSISMQSLKPFNIDEKTFHALLEQATDKGFTVTIKK